VYDVRGNVESTTDALGHGTTYAYDQWNRLATETDAEGGVTSYTYDDMGRMHTLTDSDGNTTTWTYDALSRVVAEENESGDSRYSTYSGGLLTQTIDRDGRVIRYSYDQFGRETSEAWYGSTTDTTVDETISYTYDVNGQVLTAEDAKGAEESEYTYTYDDLGRVATETQTFADAPTVVFHYTYDGNGNRTKVECFIDGTPDYVTDYTYDNLGRVTRMQQYGVAGGNAVAEKRVDYAYDANGQYATITTYTALYDVNDTDKDLVSTAEYQYDADGRLTDLVYTFPAGSTDVAPAYHYTYNAAGNMTDMYSRADTNANLDVDDFATWAHAVYANDDTGQLTGATYTNWTNPPSSTGESYTYDENGNRVTANGDTYTTGDDNQTVDDGTYSYEFDAEGNRIRKFLDADGDNILDVGETDVTIYAWDNRNRLTTATHYATYAETPVSDWAVSYTYDYQNRLIHRTYDSDGDMGMRIGGHNTSIDKIGK
jgi:YD repeat-containing protein